MSTGRPRHRLLAVTVTSLALLVAGCGTTNDTTDDDPAAVPDAGDLPTADDDTSGETTMRVYDVSEARAADEQGSLHVVGLLIDDGSGWRLCSAVLESYPPQCGGDSLRVEGLDPSVVPLEEEGDVRWQTDATLVGEIDGDTLTVTGSAPAT